MRPILISHWGFLGAWSQLKSFAEFGRLFADERTVREDLTRGRFCFSPHKDVVVPPFVDAEPSRSGERRRGAAPISGRTDFGRNWTLELLHAGGDTGKRFSAAALARLSHGNVAPAQIADAGAIAPLVIHAGGSAVFCFLISCSFCSLSFKRAALSAALCFASTALASAASRSASGSRV